jgi:chromosomal replication initiator protein DnaA
MDNIEKNWDEIKNTIRKEYNVSDVAYSTWIDPLKFGGNSGSTVDIIIPSDKSLSLDYVSRKYTDCFRVTITEMMDKPYDIRFILEKEKSENNDIHAENPVYNINYENANLNPEYTFDTFVVGSNNKLAHSAALAVADAPGQVYNPLFLYGGAGLGKTHLMHSIGHYVLKNKPDTKILYVDSEQFTNEVIESIRSGNATSMKNLRDKYRNVDILMIDDIQFIIGKESTQEEFFHTFNALHSMGKQIILSSDKPPKEMETLDERFRSRFEMGLIADIQQPDYETRMAILRKKAENVNKEINNEILDYIAANIKSNIRELEGAFNKIVAYSKLNNVDFTLENAQEALKDIINSDKPKKITPDLVIEKVAEYYGVSRDDIISKKRDAKISRPRQVVMYLTRQMTDYTLTDIGNILKKDHSTVMHGIDTVKELVDNNDDVKHQIEVITNSITM